jgi:LysM repeat protein
MEIVIWRAGVDVMRQGWLLMMIMLSLAGCFRPAGDAAPPATGVEAIETTPLATVPPLAPAGGETPSMPPVTIISPSTRTIGQGADALTQTATLLAPAANSGGSTPAFITPGVPLGPVTLVVPTPTAFDASNNGSPTSTPSGLVTPTALGVNSECTYVVQAGDNLFRIAVNNDVSLEEMRAANPDLAGDAPVLQPGQVLQLPNCTASGAPAAQAPATSPAGSVATTAPSGSGTTYTVQAGDSLFTIAQRFGITVDEIVAANSLSNPNSLSIGQQLIIPPAGE